MFGSTALEVAMGLMFIYLLLSLFCTAINEWIACILALRARTLAAGVKSLLRDSTGTGLAKGLYSHGLIEGICKKSQKQEEPLKGQDGPSYIPPRTFAAALMDLLNMALPPDPQADSKRRVEEQLGLLGKSEIEPKLKESLAALIRRANGDISRLQQNIEGWFDDAMDRVSGLYKRRAQIILFFLGMTVTVLMNADTIYLVQTLGRSPALRAAVVAEAERASDRSLPEASASDILNEIKRTSFPLGWWKSDPPDPGRDRSNLRQVFANYGWMTIIGWLLTAAAISLGAPFWFDLLNRIMRVRSTGVTPAEKGEGPAGKTTEK